MKRPAWLDAARSDKLGAKLGVGVCLLGFALIFFGWNGAASVDRIQSQFPYLISGGLGGLALVVLGAALIVVETSRDEREALRRELAELRGAVQKAAGTDEEAKGPGGSGPFVSGERSFHVPTCRLLEGRGELPRVTAAVAATRGLAACRVCEPLSGRAAGQTNGRARRVRR